MTTKALRHAESLAAEAPSAYRELRKRSTDAVVRWGWATSPAISYEPFFFELLEIPRGQMLRSKPRSMKSGMVRYGFDNQDRVIVEEECTGFSHLKHETYYRHVRDGIERFRYSYDPEKPWSNVAWMPVDTYGVMAVNAVFARGNWMSTDYAYDPAGRIKTIRRIGPNPPFADLNERWDVRYGADGELEGIYPHRPG
jgi:hypothetical protein